MIKNFSIGIDIGGTNTVWGLVNRRGEILTQGKLFTKNYSSYAEYLKAIANALEPVIKQFGFEQICGIGIGAPNANYYTGQIENAANLPWKTIIPVKMVLEEALNLPTILTNDANATAIGEMTYGAAKGMKDFIVITLGTGVGSGFVANGQLIYGYDSFAGELGHTIAVRDGRPCGCGRNGCLETYTSATGIVTTTLEMLAQQPEIPKSVHDKWLVSLSRSGKKINAYDVFSAAESGDPLALSIFDYTGKILGQSLADAVAITSPEAIIFFGGLAHAGNYLMQPLRHYMELNLLHNYKNRVKLLPSGMPESDAAILGAASLAWGGEM